ncbi:MAG: non-homologous end-joining DNA ligase [Deltaproteobacteria bacterium]|nr:non-homologous end-joining DNA ligase [Deltaproteobacteria bacterium]
MARARSHPLELAGRTVEITNPDKIYFPAAGLTKLDVALYYVAVGSAALRGIAGRPIVLKRYVDGADQPAFYQKRAPDKRPDWIETVTLAFPSGRTAEEVVVRDLGQLLWIVNLGCIDLHPHPVRAEDLEHPDELRIDLDPGPGVPWAAVCEVALQVQAVLAERGLTGWPKTSGSRGIHIWVRVAPRWGFSELRRAALAVAREVERRVPALATSKWWKEERHGVFLDYNQNAKDRTTAAAWSVRPTPDARVSMPLLWSQVAGCEPAAYTLRTVPALLAAHGDPHAGIDDAVGDLGGLLELAAADEAAGLGDAPWPPQFAKQPGEPSRVQPSRARKPRARPAEAGEPPAEPTAADTTAAPRKKRAASPTGRRKSSQPLIVVAQSVDAAEAAAGLERWKARHPAAAALLAVDDVLTDSMRGWSSTWTRIRINLRHVPEAERPAPEPPDPDNPPDLGYDPKMRPSS